MTTKEEFVQLFNQHIKREGSGEFLQYLQTTDFFTAPASTRFHSAFEGGLAQHSIKVFKRLCRLAQMQYGENWQDVLPMESVAICGLLHDVCKVQSYKVDYRNVKEDNVWVKKPFYAFDEVLPYGHGEKSVYMLSAYFRLTREEAMMINWHMGPYDLRVQGGSFALSDVFYKFPSVLLMYMADLQAAYFDEGTEKYPKD